MWYADFAWKSPKSLKKNLPGLRPGPADVPISGHAPPSSLSGRRPPERAMVRAPLGATPLNLRMQAQTAARYEDILAHVTLTGAGSRDSRLLPIWDQTRVWDPGD